MEATDNPDTLQKITAAAVQELKRRSQDLTISTGKVSRAVVDALKRSGTAAKVDEIHANIKTSAENDKKLKDAAKRAVMQFLTSIGWVEKR